MGRLSTAFPCIRCAQIFFTFDDPLLVKPEPDLFDLIGTLIEKWQARLDNGFSIRYALELYGMYFDSLENAQRIIRHRDRYEIWCSYLEDELMGISMRQDFQSTRQHVTNGRQASAVQRQGELDRV